MSKQRTLIGRIALIGTLLGATGCGDQVTEYSGPLIAWAGMRLNTGPFMRAAPFYLSENGLDVSLMLGHFGI